MSRVIVIIMAALVAAPVSASWRRYISIGSSRSDQPTAHPLAYFEVDPCARSDKTDRFMYCGGSPDVVPERSSKIRTRASVVGKLLGFTIYDLNYNFGNDNEPEDTVEIKSILVQAGPNLFHEIYVTQTVTPGSSISPTVVINAGRQNLLLSRYTDRGNAGGNIDVAFALQKDGVTLLDFAPVYAAGAKALPKGKELWFPAFKFDFTSLTWRAGTNDDGNGKAGCCVGEVRVSFRVNASGGVVPVEAKYDAKAGTW